MKDKQGKAAKVKRVISAESVGAPTAGLREAQSLETSGLRRKVQIRVFRDGRV